MFIYFPIGSLGSPVAVTISRVGGNLASIALSSFVVRSGRVDVFDFEQLRRVTKVVTKNLNKVIDRNYYPVDAELIFMDLY